MSGRSAVAAACVAAFALASAGCGGSSSEGGAPTTSPPRPPDLGCDVVSMCPGQYVLPLLAHCRGKKLEAAEARALARLEMLGEHGIMRGERAEAVRLFSRLEPVCEP